MVFGIALSRNSLNLKTVLVYHQSSADSAHYFHTMQALCYFERPKEHAFIIREELCLVEREFENAAKKGDFRQTARCNLLRQKLLAKLDRIANSPSSTSDEDDDDEELAEKHKLSDVLEPNQIETLLRRKLKIVEDIIDSSNKNNEHCSKYYVLRRHIISDLAAHLRKTSDEDDVLPNSTATIIQRVETDIVDEQQQPTSIFDPLLVEIPEVKMSRFRMNYILGELKVAEDDLLLKITAMPDDENYGADKEEEMWSVWRPLDDDGNADQWGACKW